MVSVLIKRHLYKDYWHYSINTYSPRLSSALLAEHHLIIGSFPYQHILHSLNTYSLHWWVTQFDGRLDSLWSMECKSSMAIQSPAVTLHKRVHIGLLMSCEVVLFCTVIGPIHISIAVHLLIHTWIYHRHVHGIIFLSHDFMLYVESKWSRLEQYGINILK